VVGQKYSFVPTLSQSSPSGDIGYTISNKPAWATFDTATGRLYGVPGEDHTGNFSGIRISASNGEVSASLAAFGITVTAEATGSDGFATLSWQLPTENEDGSPLMDVGGYRIYYGTSAGELSTVIDVPDPQATSFTVSSLARGTHYFALATYNRAGTESEWSDISSKSVM